MSERIEDYALIGNCKTAALVSRHGSIDWLCLPRFDSGAAFAALLGTRDNGHWQIATADEPRQVRRRYRGDTLVLETQFETESGAVTLIDCMPTHTRETDLVRVVRGNRGEVRMRMDLTIRFDYGSIVPWVTHIEGGLRAVAGPDTLLLYSDVPMHGEDFNTVAEFTVREGEEVSFVMIWHPSEAKRPPRPQQSDQLRQTEQWWQQWSSQCTFHGRYRDAVMRSLITLKALTFDPTGGIVAAPTTSLPEKIGGMRNWDYRYCWVRDATFSLDTLMSNGFTAEAVAWREWLLRAAAGRPSQLNIMYGLHGERRLTEIELDWLAGYEDSRPVRIGNAAHRQFQLDVYGELIDALYQARRFGVRMEEYAWRVEQAIAGFLESAWREPDEGIWEVRGPRQHFTHSKVMAWVAFDRMVKMVQDFGLDGPVAQWRAIRDEIHREVCARGYDPVRHTFVQHYDGQALDASLLMIPLVGFLPPEDPRVIGTVEAIERELVRDGFVMRYITDDVLDGLPPGEGAFLACSFWLVDNLFLIGRRDDAVRRFEQLLELQNDVGLLAEEYDPHAGRQVGNFPQALSHVALVESALNLTQHERAAPPRSEAG